MGTTRRGFGRGYPTKDNTLSALQNAATEAVGNVFTTRSGSKFMSGARAIIKVNGNLIGFAFDVSWSIKTDAVEVYTIDDPAPYEIAPRRISVSGTLALLQIPGRSPQDENMQSDMITFLYKKYITIEIRDSLTDELMFYTDKAMVVNQESKISADQLGSTTIQWIATGWGTAD